MLNKIRYFLLNLSKPNIHSKSKNDDEEALDLIAYMTKLITLPTQARTVLGEVLTFRQLPISRREKELPKIYLMLEQYIVEVDPLKRHTRATLRKHLVKQYPTAVLTKGIDFIFDETTDTNTYLCKQFLYKVLDKLQNILGEMQGRQFQEIQHWIKQFPNGTILPPFALAMPKNTTKETHLHLLSDISTLLFEQLETLFGTEVPIRLWGTAYEEMNEIYGGLETFPAILHLLPSKMLDDSKLRLLSRIQIEDTLLKNAHELKAINQQLLHKNEELNAIQIALLNAKSIEEKTNKLISTIIETVGECIITIDDKSIIIMANRETEKTWGYEIGELQGKPIDILMPVEFRGQHHHGLSRYLHTQNSQVLGKWITVSALHKDGHIFPIEMKIMETLIGNQRLFTAALHDITDRIQQEHLLKQKNDELDMLIYKTSHDLRGPIASILGLTQLIENYPNDHAKYAKLIEKSIYKLDETIRDLMNFGQMSNPYAVLEEINLHDLLQEVLESIRHVAGFNEVKINFDFDLSITLSSKKNLLKSIFQNLIANSINYRRKEINSFIRISISIDKKMIIAFQDNGQGIAESFQEKIFDMFFRANSQVQGSGLGLYIVRKSAETLGGAIRMKSTLGEGTCFYLSLPLELNKTPLL